MVAILDAFNDATFQSQYVGKTFFCFDILYKETGSRIFWHARDKALTYLLSCQTRDGSYLVKRKFNNTTEQGIELTLDVSMEYSIFLKLAQRKGNRRGFFIENARSL